MGKLHNFRNVAILFRRSTPSNKPNTRAVRMKKANHGGKRESHQKKERGIPSGQVLSRQICTKGLGTSGM